METISTEFETHVGPLLKGDLIVIEIDGRIVPRRPNDKRPQWFLVLNDQKGQENISLKPFNEHKKHQKPKLFKAVWKP